MRILSSFVLLLLAACTSAGSEGSRDRPTRITLTVDTTFELPFEARTSVAWLDSSHLAVIDAEAKQVVLLGLDGTVKRAGGPGSGPGEFRLPLEVVQSFDGGLLVTDIAARNIQRFDPALRPELVVSGLKLGSRILGENDDTLAIMWQVYPKDSLGRTIGRITSMGQFVGNAFRLGSIDAVFSEVKELAPGQKVQNPEAALRRDGVAVLGESRDYRLWLLSIEGQILKTGGRPGVPDYDEGELSEEEVQRALARARRITQDPEMLKQVESSIRVRLSSPRYKFRHLAVDAQLRTWVLADRGSLDSTQVDLFDEDLSYLGTLPLPGELWAIAVEGNRVAVLSGTPSDSPWQLSIYSIRAIAEPCLATILPPPASRP